MSARAATAAAVPTITPAPAEQGRETDRESDQEEDERGEDERDDFPEILNLAHEQVRPRGSSHAATERDTGDHRRQDPGESDDVGELVRPVSGDERDA